MNRLSPPILLNADNEVTMAIQLLVTAVNQLIEEQGKSVPSISHASSAYEGKIVVTKTSDTTFRVAIRHSEGWLVSDGFTFQNKEV